MKLSKVKVENFRKVSLVELTPERNLIVIAGKNANGKTSLLDGIGSALSGKKGSFKRPVRDGQERADIAITLDNGIKIHQTYRKEGGYSLKVLGADGGLMTAGNSFLSEFYNAVQFDPLSFMRLEPKKQVAQLKELLGLDFSDLDFERSQKENERKDAKKEITRIEGLMSALPEGLDDAPDEIVNVSELSAELQRLLAVEADNAKREYRISTWKENIQKGEDAIIEFEARIAKIRLEIEGFKSCIANESEPETVEPDAMDDLRDQIANAESLNNLVRAKAERNKQRVEHAKVADLEFEADQRIKAIDESKKEQIKKAKFPIEGLAFGDSDVLFNGMPLEECSAAERLKVCLAIGSAMGSDLKVMLIRDGSLLDEDSVAELQRFADEQDVQILLELVGEGGPESIVIEDGVVRGVQEPLL